MKLGYSIKPTINTDIILNVKNKGVEKYYNNVKCVKKNTEIQWDYVCFHYALVRIIKGIERKNKFDVYLDNCEDGYNILEDYFKKISIEQARKGDIITYHEINDYKSKYEKPCAENCLHFAVIFKTDGIIHNTIIKSKWGSDGVFKGQINDVPNDYGTVIMIWRKNY